MNQEILNKFFTEMTEALKDAKDFGVRQLPIAAKEILSYSMALDLVWIGVALALLIAMVVAVYKIRKFIASQKNGIDNWFGLYLIPTLGSLVPVAILCKEVPEALQIYLAPRVFLLEYIAHILPRVSGGG